MRELNEGLNDLVDGSRLLGCRLSGSEEVIADRRRGYLVIATARPGAAPPGPGDWERAADAVTATREFLGSVLRDRQRRR